MGVVFSWPCRPVAQLYRDQGLRKSAGPAELRSTEAAAIGRTQRPTPSPRHRNIVLIDLP